ncbi:hypothetical protein EVAR_77108_1 [Eumeta japonica]|uniref:Uncharacterized protein n=1 Tax=Eumeta variegata TaxID=151549 RepID=A0A4C1T4B0_EUMVA|nr:hypothetical protein EVAR_77108_1 [Eumeta japonica]
MNSIAKRRNNILVVILLNLLKRLVQRNRTTFFHGFYLLLKGLIPKTFTLALCGLEAAADPRHLSTGSIRRGRDIGQQLRAETRCRGLGGKRPRPRRARAALIRGSHINPRPLLMAPTEIDFTPEITRVGGSSGFRLPR